MLAACFGTVLYGNTMTSHSQSAPSLLRRPVGHGNESLPVVGLGTWQAFDIAGNETELARARDALRAFVDGGGELIDSSPMYGSAEAVAGELAAGLGIHPRLFIATKVWTSGREAGIRQMETSIARMQSSRKGPLDLMQVHNLVDVETHLATLRLWKRERRIRYLGVTHYHAGSHRNLAKVIAKGDIDFLQVNYSLAEPQADDRLLQAAVDTRTAVIINRPFAEGAMFGRVKGKPVPDFASALECSSWAQLFLKWIVSHPAVTCAIPGTRNPAHVRDNLGAARGPMPDAAMRQRIQRAFEQA